jgi:hypothetical protein
MKTACKQKLLAAALVGALAAPQPSNHGTREHKTNLPVVDWLEPRNGQETQ